MTISKKIIGGYAIVLALLVLVTGIAFYSLEKTQATYDRFLDVNERLVDGANELRFELRDQVAHYRGILLYPDLQKKYWDELAMIVLQFVPIFLLLIRIEEYAPVVRDLIAQLHA